jgi:hypothetical protein
MANTSPQDLPNRQNTSSELRASIATSGDEKIVENHQDSDIKMATSCHVNHPIHNTEVHQLSPSTAISPPKHLQKTPKKLPATATNLGVASVPANISGTGAKGTGGVPPPTPPPPPSPTKHHDATSPAATKLTDLPLLKKRKKKRLNKSLSRHVRGRKAKAVKSDGPKNVFPAPREVSSSLPPDPPSHGSIKPPPMALQMKSIRNKKDYERRKAQRAEQAVEHLKDELSTVRATISCLEYSNKRDSIEVSHLKASAEKSALTLAKRTERFVAYRTRKEDEIKSLKAQAEKRIAALEKNHKFVLAREKVERYRMERAHTKEIASKNKEISSVQRAKE